MASRRKSTKKQVDKWKLKRSYKVVAPVAFGGKDVGEVISSTPTNLLNRIVLISLADLMGPDSNQHSFYVIIRLRIISVGEDSVQTELVGHSTSFSYLRSIARRRRSVIHDSFSIKTKDGKTVLLKPTTITLRKVSSIVKRNLRRAIIDSIKEKAIKYSYNDLMKEILSGDFAKSISKEINKINPISHLLIKKAELLDTVVEVAK